MRTNEMGKAIRVLPHNRTATIQCLNSIRLPTNKPALPVLYFHEGDIERNDFNRRGFVVVEDHLEFSRIRFVFAIRMKLGRALLRFPWRPFQPKPVDFADHRVARAAKFRADLARRFLVLEQDFEPFDILLCPWEFGMFEPGLTFISDVIDPRLIHG